MAALRVESVTWTCGACPSQWEGRLDDGRRIYVRYRWGRLSVRVSDAPTDDTMDAVGGTEVVGVQLSDGLDGLLTYEELGAATRGVVEWPAAVSTDEV